MIAYDSLWYFQERLLLLSYDFQVVDSLQKTQTLVLDIFRKAKNLFPFELFF